MSRAIPPACFTACLLAPSCTGTETDNPSIDFDFAGSQCKKTGFSEKILPGATSAALMSDDLRGLHCIAWNADDEGRLKLQVSNYDGPCLVEVEWEGRVLERKDGGFDLRVAFTDPECRIAACGSCLYDFQFEIEGVDTHAPLPLSFGDEICGEPDDSPVELTLPLDEGRDGLACRHVNRGTLDWLSMCGSAHTPCGETADDCELPDEDTPEPWHCEEGLTCSEEDGQRLCLRECDSDEDCPLAGVETCVDGLCHLQEGF